MFWKIDNMDQIKSVSLVNKLILFYSLSTLFIVTIVCVILFPTFEKVTHLANPAYQDNLFSQCIEKLAIALMLSIICAIIFGSIITRKGMKQINLLSEKIKNITIDSLDKLHTNDLSNELKPLADSFNVMIDKLQNSFNQLSEFSADIAHELRTPIQNLFAMNEIALTHDYSLDKYYEIFENNMEECRHLLKLIENLWFIARTDHGQTLISKKPFEVRKEILNIIDYYEPLASESKIDIYCEGNAILYADIILFKRLINNILSNALKYTQENGKIHIKIESLSHFITVSIHDSGVGIDEVHLSKIFNRFYRVDRSRTSATGGLGLGLAIVKAIMDLHKGNVDIQSKINIGTSIFLNFPIHS